VRRVDQQNVNTDYNEVQQLTESKIANLEKFYRDNPGRRVDQQNVNTDYNEAQQPSITIPNSSPIVNTKTLGRKDNEGKHGSSLKRKRKWKK